MTVLQSQIETPTEASIFTRMLEFRIADIHTCMPASVTEYSPERNTVDVQPLLKRAIVHADGTREVLSCPPLKEIPILFPRGGRYAITWPLEVGDVVILLFAERSIDEWSIAGGETEPKPARKHDWSDAIAIPGCAPVLSAIPDLNQTDMKIGEESGPNFMVIKPNQGAVEISAAENINLGGDNAVARVGDAIQIDIADPRNQAFALWVAAVAAASVNPPTAPPPASIFGRIITGSTKVTAG